MGSLPNLHELSRDSDSEDGPESRHTVPITGPSQHHKPILDERILNRTNTVPYNILSSTTATTGRNKCQGHVPQTTVGPLHRGSGGVPLSLCRTRSNGNHNHIYGDSGLLMEQVTSYSPTMSRSTRTLTNAQHQILNNNNNNIHHLLGSRRRESLNSSIGATSVRRLIGVVRNPNSSRLGPIYNRQILIKNLLTLCVTHFLISASLLPLIALQSSISVWHWPLKHHYYIFATNFDLGSILLAILYLFASLSSLVSPILVQKCGTTIIFILSYIIFSIFFGAHFFPIVYVLFPVYVLLGFILGPLTLSRVTFVMTLSSKMSYIATDDDDFDEHHKHHVDARRTILIRRLARALQGAQDIGLIVGSIITAIIISYNFNSDAFINVNHNSTIDANNSCTNCQNVTTEIVLTNSEPVSTLTTYYYASYDDLFDIDDSGCRICGSNACPITLYYDFNSTKTDSALLNSNFDLADNFLYVLPLRTSTILISIYLVFTLIAFVLACVGLDKIQLLIHQDPMERSMGLSALRAIKETFKDIKLQLSATLAIFIGLEQGFMYSDFSKSYVLCALGVYNINLVFLSMGLLQSLAAFTLSMLLRTIQRYIVIAVGVAFQSLLIMVCLLWKPSGDDPALFYVISAAWGVCNSIWEMLNFTMLSKHYTDNWEPAFANSIFFRFIGLSLAYGMHGLLCNWIKLYLLAFVLLLAIVPYAFLEMRLENTKKLKHISRL